MRDGFKSKLAATAKAMKTEDPLLNLKVGEVDLDQLDEFNNML